MAEGEPRPEASVAEADGNRSDASSVPSPPPPPVPAADPKLQAEPPSDLHVPSPTLAAQVDDIFQVSPQAALSLLSAGIEALVSMTGDIPPTPPPRSPSISHMRGMEAEKMSIVRSNSEKSLTRLAQRASASSSPLPVRSPLPPDRRAFQPRAPESAPSPTTTTQDQPVDGVRLRVPNGPLQTPPPDSPNIPRPLSPYIIVGENSQPLNVQHSAITRRFYCRVPPPISITDYLLRIHCYCPMSVGVYLAASLYIHRLAVLERAIAVTKRNAHRLLLASLRVAMKALEDLSFPHSKFARVGGVSEKELARLEISFCFLTGFELAVDVPKLSEHWGLLRRGVEGWNVLDQEIHQDGPFVQLGTPPSGSDGVQAQG